MRILWYYLLDDDGGHASRRMSKVQAERWIVAALAEAHALHAYDADLFPQTSDEEPIGRAERLHASWNAWAEQARKLVEQVRERAVLSKHEYVVGLHDLRVEIGLADCYTQETPRNFVRRMIEFHNNPGPRMTTEEVRNELGLASRA